MDGHRERGGLSSNGSTHSNTTSKKKRQLIGIDGHWYDVTAFIPHHPGGDVIKQFIGKDASSAFHAFHKPSVLQSRRPTSKMEVSRQDDITLAFARLGDFFEKEGYFEYDIYWYLRKIILSFAILMAAFGCAIYWQQSTWKYLGALALAAFWQQCGFLMHDSEHNLITGNRHVDSWIGTFFATLCFGVNGSWWRDDHFVHHALTTCVDHKNDFYDPQMREVIWAQNEKLWPFFRTKIELFCIKIQHVTFLPVCLLLGRIGIMGDSMKDERQPGEIIAFALHWLWISSLLSWMPSWREVFIFYGIAAILQGILHVQLLISHYSKKFHYLDDICSKTQWYRMQVESNIDIEAPWFMDWFHGGLNFHLVHHLYPRMPRYNYRKATDYVRQVCKEQGLEYDSCGWFDAVYRTLCHLRLMARHFSLDPR